MTTIPHSKRCTKCSEEKPLSEFVKGPRYADGYQPWCADCRRAYHKQRGADPVKRHEDSARTLAWVKANPREQERRKRYDKDRWRNNPAVRQRKNAQKHAAISRDPVKRARERMRNRLRAHHRRTLTRSGSVTAAQWRKLCRQFNHCCAACGKKTKLTIDHVIPLSKGGNHSIENIQPLCLMCNQIKNTKTTDYRPVVQLSMELDI